MIETLRARNFKALRDVEVKLRPFTVLIGPNDSGKSSILQALDALSLWSVGFDEPVQQGSMGLWRALFGHEPERIVYRGEYATRDVELAVSGHAAGSREPFDYSVGFHLTPSRGEVSAESAHSITLGRTSRSGIIYPADELVPLAQELACQLVRFQPESLAMPSSLRKGESQLDSDGHGLAAVIDAMITGPDRRLIVHLEEQLHKLVPTVRGVSLVTTDIKRQGHNVTGKALELVLAAESDGRPVTIPIAQASDGVILALGYLALVYTQTARCLLVDEPENGLHPHALGFIVDLLQKVSRGEIGGDIGLGPRQVVMTTHSPLLLNYVDPEDVLIVTRSADNVIITPMVDAPHFAELSQDFDVGELWYNVGEKGLVRS